MFQYFQGIRDYQHPITPIDEVLEYLSDIPINQNLGVVDGKTRIKIVTDKDEIWYIDYYDKWGFMDRRDFYEANVLSYSEYFDDNAKLNSRIYYDSSGQAVITCRYHGDANSQPVLSLIMLNHGGKHHQFDDLDQLMAYFLDCLSLTDNDPRFYSDREDIALPPFKLMKQSAKRYVILHSVFTTNAKPDGDLYPYIKMIQQMPDKLTGIISSTTAEAKDVQFRLPEIKSFAVPVSYIPNGQFNKQLDFNKRIPGQLIAVARVTKIKQLDQIINIALKLHQKLPNVDLKIYGYEDSTSNPATVSHLHQMVSANHAEDYIHFCGYVQDLTQIYEQADILALTSEFEGFSMAVLEALEHGCPVVSYDINYGPSEMIKDGINGKLIAPNDVESMYNVILRLLSNQELLRTYSQLTMEPLRKFSDDEVKQNWLKVIQEED